MLNVFICCYAEVFANFRVSKEIDNNVMAPKKLQNVEYISKVATIHTWGLV